MSAPTLTRLTDPDLSTLEYVLAATAGLPELYATSLPGETNTERAARLEAAAHITDTLLADHPNGVRAGVEELAEHTGRYVDLITDQARQRVASWMPGEGAAA